MSKLTVKIEDAAFDVMREREILGYTRLPKTDLELAVEAHKRMAAKGSRVSFKTVLNHIEKRFY